MTKKDLDEKIMLKTTESENLLIAYSSTPESARRTLAKVYEQRARSVKYKEDYIAVNRDKVTGIMTPVFNNLVMINEQRTFDIQQVDYADRFSVFTSIDREFGEEAYVPEERDIDKFFEEYDSLSTYVDKIHFIVDSILEFPEYKDAIIGNLSDSDKIKQQLIVVGPEKIKGLGYNITKIKKAMGITIFDKSQFFEEVYSEFIPGQRYTKKYIKEKLGEIYKKMDYKGTPKATDLSRWFEIKDTRITIDNKREIGFEIISKKF